MSDRIVGHFFHEGDITSAVYLDTLDKFMFPWIVAEVDGLLFQQYGAPAYFSATARTTLDE
jgi:hypothetical protein